MNQINYGNLTIEIKNVTPEMASEILAEHNGLNRKINKRHVSALALNMEKGTWKFNGDSIRFDNKGNLIDGQHRLSAIVESNKPMTMLFVSGLDTSIIRTIDQEVKPRNLNDILKMDNVKYASQVASCLNRYFAIKVNCASFIDSNRTYGSSAATSVNVTKADYTVYDKYDEYNQYTDFWQSVVKYALNCNHTLNILKVAEIAAIFAYLVHDKLHPIDEVKGFFDRIFFDQTDCALLLKFRTIFTNDKLSVSPMMPKTRSGLLIKAWNMYHANQWDNTDISYNPIEENMPKFD